uniref:KIB1-4 beta-propeller domain-containing protein n=1 Tax=Aegilops tauschii TaxID=37682 RepID=M8CDF6_AEGTA
MSSQPWRGHALLNLRTGERVALPERVRIPLEFGLGVITCPMMIRAAVMSSAPPSGACLVAAVTSSQTNLAFWRPGMECWLSAPAVGRFVRNAEDITYHDGWFCAVESDDDLVCYKPEIAPAEDGAPSLTIRHHAYNLHVHGHRTAPREIVSRYLLPSASGADLLMVKRVIAPTRGGTCRFQVFRLQEGLPASWRLYKMSGQVLFVGRACSKAFYTGHTGGPVGCILQLLSRFTTPLLSRNQRDPVRSTAGSNNIMVLCTNSPGIGDTVTIHEFGDHMKAFALSVLYIVGTEIALNRVGGLAGTLGFDSSFGVASSGHSGLALKIRIISGSPTTRCMKAYNIDCDLQPYQSKRRAPRMNLS